MNEITNPTPEQQRKANSIARKNGYGKATKIILGNTDEVVSHISYGFRKYTTGEYVPKSYLHNFGWKNTYYQNAETTVMIKDEKKVSLV